MAERSTLPTIRSVQTDQHLYREDRGAREDPSQNFA